MRTESSEGTVIVQRSQHFPEWSLLLFLMLSVCGQSLDARAGEVKGDARPVVASSPEDAEPVKVEYARLPDHAEVSLGTLFVKQQNRRHILLVNKSSEAMSIVSLDTGCGCVQAKANGEPIAPGKSAGIFIDISPELQSEQFSQSIRVRFDASTVHDLELRLAGKVIGPITVEPRAINFRKADGAVDIVVAPASSAVVVQSCKEVRGVLSILSKDTVSGELRLRVLPDLSHGQAVALLRVAYEEAGVPSVVDIPIAVQGSSEVRFIPSTLTQLELGDPVRIIAIFTNDSAPAKNVDAQLTLKSAAGKDISEPLQYQVVRMSDRRFDISMTFREKPAENRGFLCFKLGEREYLCPFVFED